MNQKTLRRSMASSALAAVSLFGGVALVLAGILRRGENGWGAVAWLAAVVAQVAIRMPHLMRNRANEVVERRVDPGEMWLLTGMVLAGLVLPVVALTTTFLSFADYVVPGWVTALGVALDVAAVWLFWRSHADLGRNWSLMLEIRGEHEIVTHGVYARIRHPMYAALWLFALAQPLLIHNAVAGLLVIPAYGAIWLRRTPREEAMMRERFGKAYEDYVARTGRIIPRWRGRTVAQPMQKKAPVPRRLFCRIFM